MAIAEAPEMFRPEMQECLDVGGFSEVWKRQNLALLPKAGKLPFRYVDTNTLLEGEAARIHAMYHVCKLLR